MTRFFLLLLTLLLSLNGPAMGEYSDFGRSFLAAKSGVRRVGRSPNAPLLHSVPNQNDGRVWLADGPIGQGDFFRLVSTGVDRGQQVTVLTGTHGTNAGGLVPERAFFNEDLAIWASQTADVKLIDVTRLSPRQLQMVLNRDGRIICGWCDSASSTAVEGAMGGTP